MNQKILIVDDDPQIRFLLDLTFEELSELGVKILIAEDGGEALYLIKSEKPDLVFLDIMMPKIDGLEVCNIVKNDLNMKGVFIIMLTAQGQEIDKQKGELAGADLYITKPFDPDELLDKAVEILQIKN